MPYSGLGQLPKHEINHQRLIRIFLRVHYDYVENRVGAISAHITKSEYQANTGFIQVDGRWRPDPELSERLVITDNGNREELSRPITGESVIGLKREPWTNNYEIDTIAERELLESFFRGVVSSIQSVAEVSEAPIHFYVWSRSEITHLIEACSRCGTHLLRSLRELLGCRESLEQLIFSCLQDEVNQRYATGWTGKGLGVVTSLRWYGSKYHWIRRVNGQDINIENSFTQDIFDFKTDLELTDSGSWASSSDEASISHKFEVRSRFYDTLTAPYWRAYWGVLTNTDVNINSGALRNMINRYNRASIPGVLEEFLRSSSLALRWIEERIRFKNDEISKPLIELSRLPTFTLGVDDVSDAAIDFLRLEQHMKVTDWIKYCLVPPVNRVPHGKTIPLRDCLVTGRNSIRATINLESFGINIETLRNTGTIDTGSFVRLIPCAEDPQRGQTIRQLFRAGSTCVVTDIDWENSEINLSVIPLYRTDRYRLQSFSYNNTNDRCFSFATLDESPSNYVASRVEARLRAASNSHVYNWFDPVNPSIPPADELNSEDTEDYRSLLSSYRLPNGHAPDSTQIQACMEGLSSRIQLLQGPPGTGKTTTTAIAVILRISLRRDVGDILLVSGTTHNAVNNLLIKIDELQVSLRSHFEAAGINFPPLNIGKVHSLKPDVQTGGNVVDFSSYQSSGFVNSQIGTSILIIGGTTSAIHKMTDKLNRVRPFATRIGGFNVSELIIDEASMMVFPDFLSLSTLVSSNGYIMLVGDHRQLAPILSHDWESEDRPPTVLYQPFVSSYQAVQNICSIQDTENNGVVRSALCFSFRLPSAVRELISNLYRLDQIELDGNDRPIDIDYDHDNLNLWQTIWSGSTGLFLVMHNERQSKKSNALEAFIVQSILSFAPELEQGSVAIMTPHRAQRSLLKISLSAFEGPVDVIDTVERLQGGERQNIIFSATASDPTAISKNVRFLLDGIV